MEPPAKWYIMGCLKLLAIVGSTQSNTMKMSHTLAPWAGPVTKFIMSVLSFASERYV
jgi:hypothetical protein